MTRLPRSRRLAFVSAILLVGLSACGSNDTPAAGTQPMPPVIQIAGGAGGAAGTALDAAASPESSKMMPMSVNYVYSGDIADLTAPAAAWYFAAGIVPTTEQITALATALGVSGDVRQLAADMGGGFAVGSADYTGDSITVGSDAMQSWWFSPGAVAAESTAPCELYPPGDPAGNTTTADAPVCATPTPPAGVPTADEAKAKAVALFESIGIAVNSYEFETYADEWGANVTGYLTIEGVRTSATISAGFGAEGAVTWASGFLATPQRGADYPRVGIDAAVARLNDQQFMMYPMTRGMNAVGYADDTATVSGVAPGVASGAVTDVAPLAVVPPDAPVSEPPCDIAASCTVDTMPVDTMPVDAPTDTMPVETMPIDPVTITLTNAHASLEQVWAADGTVWMLPGYAFDAADQGMYSVIAVDDQYLAFVDPAPVPMPDVLPVDGTAVTGSGSSGSGTVQPGTPVPAVEPATGGTAAPDLATASAALVGLTESEATDVATANGWLVRVVRRDGVDLPSTDDYRENRYNLAIVGGVVSEVLSQG
ncbi:MAG: hypothetical protein RLZZ623_3802 [Actinomycetota bacterium]